MTSVDEKVEKLKPSETACENRKLVQQPRRSLADPQDAKRGVAT